MAAKHGKDGAVHIGTPGAGTKVTKIRTWSFNQTRDLADASGMGDDQKQYVPGLADNDVTITAIWDHSDALQANLRTGQTIAVTLRPSEETGQKEWAGSIVVSSFSPAVTVDGVTQFTIQAKGPLTEATQ